MVIFIMRDINDAVWVHVLSLQYTSMFFKHTSVCRQGAEYLIDALTSRVVLEELSRDEVILFVEMISHAHTGTMFK